MTQNNIVLLYSNDAQTLAILLQDTIKTYKALIESIKDETNDKQMQDIISIYEDRITHSDYFLKLMNIQLEKQTIPLTEPSH